MATHIYIHQARDTAKSGKSPQQEMAERAKREGWTLEKLKFNLTNWGWNGSGFEEVVRIFLSKK